MAPRLEPEKREEVVRYLSDPLMASNTNESIARLVGCDEGTVRRIRSKLNLGESLMESNRKVIERIPLDRVVIDPEIQPREFIDADVVNEYKDGFRDEVAFPPIVVVRIGDSFLVADGFHRTKAAQKAKQPDILADIREGNREDAIFLAAGANTTHGKQRSKGDKSRAVQMLLKLGRCKGWSQRTIADYVHVSPGLVNKVISESPTVQVEQLGATSTGKDGRTRRRKKLGSNPTPNGTPPGPPIHDPDTADDSMSANPETGDAEEGETESSDESPTFEQQVGRGDRNGTGLGVEVEDVVHDPVSTATVAADPRAEFLATMPKLEVLQGFQRDSYRADILLYFDTGKTRKPYHADVRSHVQERKAGKRPTPYARKILSPLEIANPRDWPLCANLSDGTCGPECMVCGGYGYHVTYENRGPK